MKAVFFALLALSAVALARPFHGPSVVAHRPTETVECWACEHVFSAIEGWIASNHTEDEIGKLLDGLCAILPSGARPTCEKIMSVGVHEVIAALEAAESPAEVCRQIGACTGPAPVDPVGCQMCVYLMHDLEGWVDDNKTIEEIESFVDQICNIMPSALQPTCQHAVDVGVARLIQMLIDAEGPRTVCEQIGACSKPSRLQFHHGHVVPAGDAAVLSYHARLLAAKAKANSVAKSNGIGCYVCELIFKAIEKWLASNATETEIDKILDLICEILPSSASGTCQKIVSRGVAELIRALETYETPSEVCRELGLCDEPEPDETLGCFMCKFIVLDIEKFVEEEKTLAEIEAFVAKICKILPDSSQPLCTEIVDDVVADVVKALIAKETPGAICFGLGACNSTAVAKH